MGDTEITSQPPPVEAQPAPPIVEDFVDVALVSSSAKSEVLDPSTGRSTRVLTVASREGVATFDVDRLARLRDMHRGAAAEEDWLERLEYCRYGGGGSPADIDTAMHAFVASEHVQHSHPTSILALGVAVDGQSFAKECFGDDLVWVPWRRPGFELGLDIAEIQRDHSGAFGAVLEGHGLVVWGSTHGELERRRLGAVQTAVSFIDERGRPQPFGVPSPGRLPLPAPERQRRAASLAPVLRGLASTDHPTIGHFTDSNDVLDFIGSADGPRLASLGTPYPEQGPSAKLRPLVVDTNADDSLEDVVARTLELDAEFRQAYRDYYLRHAGPDSPAIWSSDPRIIVVPGVGMFSFGDDKRGARLVGQLFISAINVIAGAQSLSTFAPISETEMFQIEYGPFEGKRLERVPDRKPLAGRIAVVTGAASGIGRATAERMAAEGACVVVADRNAEVAYEVAGGLGPDVAISTATDVTDEQAVKEMLEEASLAFGGVDVVVNNAGLSISKPLLETEVTDWDVQHDVMARGSFLVSREAARVMIAQRMGGDIVYIVSKNGVFAGPNNVAYGSAKADQAHQVRLLAAELGEHGIRVNGVNPDGVVRGSGIFASGWGAERAALYGVDEEDLGEFYAQRTLLRKEVLPEHVAAAVFALTGGELLLTTGAHIPVDGGVAAAFLR